MKTFFYTTTASIKMIRQFLNKILPLVNQEVNAWQTYAQANMHGELQKQALASISGKRFHCQGGNFYSIYPSVDTEDFIKFIVALQTISDYLDNLCDRAAVTDEAAFRQLHLAMTDALDPEAIQKEYYAQYPFQDDSSYLANLVTTCQTILKKIPSYGLVKPTMLKLATLYSQLQTYKHIDPAVRESAMLVWLRACNTTLDLTDWEFAAATGSTLGMFMLAAIAYNPALSPEEVTAVEAAYFPWICGLHIQLDYFIDQAEDRANGDLNFVFYYKDEIETSTRLQLFYREAYRKAELTPHNFFTKTIVRGLPALYLSDQKIKTPTQKAIRKDLLHQAGVFTQMLYALCKLLRYKKTL
ncbi:MAG: hypothetical protein H6Q70_3873 [Firmicutes bacterium]|nr:hypothetical protein [Bacillota bacterium]